MDQDELWAILDGVESNVEEDIDNLVADDDTEFETMTTAAEEVLNKELNHRTLITTNTLEAVIHVPEVLELSKVNKLPTNDEITYSSNSDSTIPPKVDFLLASLFDRPKRKMNEEKSAEIPCQEKSKIAEEEKDDAMNTSTPAPQQKKTRRFSLQTQPKRKMTEEKPAEIPSHPKRKIVEEEKDDAMNTSISAPQQKKPRDFR